MYRIFNTDTCFVCPTLYAQNVPKAFAFKCVYKNIILVHTMKCFQDKVLTPMVASQRNSMDTVYSVTRPPPLPINYFWYTIYSSPMIESKRNSTLYTVDAIYSVTGPTLLPVNCFWYTLYARPTSESRSMSDIPAANGIQTHCHQAGRRVYWVDRQTEY